LYQAVFRNLTAVISENWFTFYPGDNKLFFVNARNMSLHFEYYKNRLIELHERRIRHGGVERYYLLFDDFGSGLISEWFYNWLSRVRQRTIVATA